MSTKQSSLGKRTPSRNIQDGHPEKKVRTEQEAAVVAGLTYTQQLNFCKLAWDKHLDFRRQMKPLLRRLWNPLNTPETIEFWNQSGLLGRRLLKAPTFKMKDARAIFIKLVREDTQLRDSILNIEHFAPLLRSFESPTGVADAEFKIAAPSFNPFSSNLNKADAAAAEKPATNPSKAGAAAAEEPTTTTQDPKFSIKQIVKWDQTGDTSYAILGCMRQEEQWKYRIYANAGLIYVPERELQCWSM